jgi:hypothetical protein
MATDTQTKTELPDDATHEDIEAAVDQIIADRTANEPPEVEETSDAEKVGTGKVVTEREDTEDTADVENRKSSGSDDSEETGKAKAAKSDDAEGSASDWRAEAKAEAAAYGFSEEEIAEFQSREELDRALKLFDRKLDAERKKVLGEPKGEKDKGGEAQKKAPEADSKESYDGTYHVGLDPDIYDEEIVGEFTRLRDHYETRLAALDDRFQNAEAIAAEDVFDRSVDDLEFSQLFGKTGEESDVELKRRNELFERVNIEQLVMSRLEMHVDHNSLVKRVARGLFPDEYDKKLLKNHTRKIFRQSDKRQGSGATRSTDPPQGLREEMRELYEELDQGG